MRRFAPHLLLIGLTLALTACGPTISRFNARAYEQATALKVEARSLMDQATTPYSQHREDVQALKTELQKAYEFARGRPKNKISAQQWKILIDPERDLLGGFFRDWQERSTLPSAFVKEKKAQISDAFDTIIELESGKLSPDAVRAGS